MAGHWRAGLAVAVTIVALTPAHAVGAQPIVAGAAPLSMQFLRDDPGNCPTPGTSSNEVLEQLIGGELQRRRPNLNRVFTALSFPQPTLLLCDPEALAARRWLGGITGSSELTIHDTVWWGQRGLLASATDGAPATLRVGDEIVLPATGPNAQLTASVRTSTGSSTVSVPAASTAARLTLTGSTAAPVVRVQRTDGTTTDLRSRFAQQRGCA